MEPYIKIFVMAILTVNISTTVLIICMIIIKYDIT